MWTPERVIEALTARGEIWEVAPGLTGMRGATRELCGRIEHAIAAIAGAETADEWRVPPGIDLGTLARADYFASFPQWLTLASHLSDDERVLGAIAASRDPVTDARAAAAPAGAALQPAVCYHAYARLAGQTLDSPTTLTAQATCWRHEGARHAALERGWAFTMREIVCLGTEADTASFRDRGVAQARRLADALGLTGRIAEAQDPFFAPTARGKAVLQRLKALKHELLLCLPGGREVAAASFNLHEQFFGDAFGIRAGGASAWTACVAFGIERWVLAVLCAHGPDPRDWPAIPDGAR